MNTNRNTKRAMYGLPALAAAFTAFAALNIAAPAHAQSQFFVRTATPTVNTPFYPIVPDNIVAGEALFNPINNANISGYSIYPFINFDGSGTDLGQFLNGYAFPNNLSNTDYFALEAIANIQFVSSGFYTFRVNSDDGFTLRINRGLGEEFYSNYIPPRGPANTDGPALFFNAGQVIGLRLTYFEQAGGEEVELSYSQDGRPFALVTGLIGVQQPPDPPGTPAAPEPSTFVLLVAGSGMGGSRFLQRWHKRRKPSATA